MSSDDHIAPVHASSSANQTQRTERAEAKQKIANMAARQVASEQLVQELSETALFNRPMIRKEFKELEQRLKQPPKGQETTRSEEEKAENLGETAAAEQIAEDYYQRNPELQKQTLMMMYRRLQPNDTPNDILNRLQKTFNDQWLADETLGFLIEASKNRQDILSMLIESKERFNAQFGREIRAGKNIAVQARAFSEAGLGSPLALRNLYREITGNPRDAHQLFQELTQKFRFPQMKQLIDFILHSLGSDLKAKGSSIPHAELQRLFSEARTMQAILSVFRFFLARMRLIRREFKRFNLQLPPILNFENLAKPFMKFIQERYPSSEKIIKLALALGIAEEVMAQIIIFTQYRDALRHLSPKLFQSERHRQDLLVAFMEALSDLEDAVEEEEEEEGNKEDESSK